jgi:RimJ/RimL family protein N-acetyltransferase
MGVNIWQNEAVRLRAVEPEDWKIFMDWNLDTETARMCYFIPFPQSAVDVQRFALETSQKRGENDHYVWMIENPDGIAVGNLNSHDTDRRIGTFSYGVAIRREFWGKGYAPQAIRLVLNYFFNELGYQKCNVGVYSFNSASIRLHEKLGFVREGQRRRTIYTAGQYFDDVLFGMTIEEYRARWPS